MQFVDMKIGVRVANLMKTIYKKNTTACAAKKLAPAIIAGYLWYTARHFYGSKKFTIVKSTLVRVEREFVFFNLF